MSLWDALTGWIDNDSQQMISKVIDPKTNIDPPVNDVGIVAGQHYIRLRLADMFLTKQVAWFKSWYPAVHSVVRFDFGNRSLEVPNIADSTRVGMQQGGQGDVVARNFVLTPTIPFNGGIVSLNAGLVAIEGKNYLNSFLKTLGNFAGLLGVAQLSAALNVAQPLALGLQELFGAGQNHLHLGMYNSYAEKELKAGYIVVIRATETQVKDTSKLWVVADQLRTGNSLKQNTPFTGYDYMLFRVEVFDKRDDWEQLTAIQNPFQAAIRALHNTSDTSQAIHYLRTALLEASQSPELTKADRRRVVDSLKEQFEQAKKDFSVDAAFTGKPPTLKQAMKYAIPIKEALKKPQPTPDEIFAYSGPS